MGNRIVSIIAAMLLMTGASAQQYTGMGGLIQVPSADMDTVPVAHIGAHYVDQHMVPDRVKLDGKKYNTWTNYLTIQPFRWIEIGYGYTLWKFHKNKDPKAEVGFYAKDRYFSVRVQPIREARWWPSVVLGGNDVWGSGDEGQSSSNYYKNFYVALSKHVEVEGQWIGAHIAYRKWKRDYNRKWDGVVGGITVQPSFYRPLRFIAEWDGCEPNVGVDCTLFRYVMLQASLQNMQYFSGGVCLRIPLVRIGSRCRDL